jgi:ArsR family transcriptional regulator, arsenate/arsenite/antimonite-responsive transcriptional repressor
VQRETAVLALGALAQGIRLELVSLLAASGAEGLSAGVIAARLGVPPASLSFHFQQLVRARLVTQRRRSRFVIYSANTRVIDCLLAFLNGHCRSQHLQVESMESHHR